VAAPVTVLALYAAADLLGPALLSSGLLVLAVVAARWALAPAPTASEEAAATPHHPWVLMNRRSGGGKVDRFGPVDKARAAGCRVRVLDPGQDVTALARQAVADGADLLGVAGGDGTQALVADVAAHHDVPFAVVPAGTRNHFAHDLGLDRDDPVAAQEALAVGEVQDLEGDVDAESLPLFFQRACLVVVDGDGERFQPVGLGSAGIGQCPECWFVELETSTIARTREGKGRSVRRSVLVSSAVVRS